MVASSSHLIINRYFITIAVWNHHQQSSGTLFRTARFVSKQEFLLFSKGQLYVDVLESLNRMICNMLYVKLSTSPQAMEQKIFCYDIHCEIKRVCELYFFPFYFIRMSQSSGCLSVASLL